MHVCQQKQKDLDTLVSVGRLRGHLLLVLRYMLWRLEAYRSRACWDTDAVSEPGTADIPEALMLDNIKQIHEVLQADHYALLHNFRDWVYAVRSQLGQYRDLSRKLWHDAYCSGHLSKSE